MDPETEQPQAEQTEQAQLNDFGKIAFHFLKYGQNATNNLKGVFSEMTPQEWIRLIAIVGAYLLLRPYAMKWLGKRQVESMEKQEAEEKAKLSPNDLRDGTKLPEDEDDDEDGETSATDWGSRARTRQRTMLKQLLEAEERRKQEEDDDKDIADLLED